MVVERKLGLGFKTRLIKPSQERRCGSVCLSTIPGGFLNLSMTAFDYSPAFRTGAQLAFVSDLLKFTLPQAGTGGFRYLRTKRRPRGTVNLKP